MYCVVLYVSLHEDKTDYRFSEQQLSAMKGKSCYFIERKVNMSPWHYSLNKCHS